MRAQTLPHAPLSSIESLRAWTLDHLPQLNARALAGELAAADLAALISREALASPPDPQQLGAGDALRLLLVLGLLGSSVERHAQQQSVLATRAPTAAYAERQAIITPGLGLAALLAGGEPFVPYFARVADRVGHPHRDSLMTLVEFNGPPVEVRHPLSGDVLLMTHAAFADSRFLTFSDNATEEHFFRLGKLTIALQTAANRYLAELHDPQTDLASPQAVESALNAAQLMWAMRARIIEFIKRVAFDVDFFLDVFRQYQCLWYPAPYLKPPSAANDAASLHRDVMLFDNLVPPYERFPGFRGHVEEVCSVLLPAHRAELHAALALPSIESRIAAASGLRSLPPAQALAEAPWLGAYLQLYNAQRDVSRAHYGLVTKYIIRPKQGREERGDPREQVTVVDNARGTTGMDPIGIMVRLDQARDQHPLAHLNADPDARRRAAEFLGGVGFAPLGHERLLELARFAE